MNQGWILYILRKAGRAGTYARCTKLLLQSGWLGGRKKRNEKSQW